jgi:hypothetical protein
MMSLHFCRTEIGRDLLLEEQEVEKARSADESPEERGKAKGERAAMAHRLTGKSAEIMAAGPRSDEELTRPVRPIVVAWQISARTNFYTGPAPGLSLDPQFVLRVRFPVRN